MGEGLSHRPPTVLPGVRRALQREGRDLPVTLTTDLNYRPWSKQLDVHESEARFRVVIAGRQSGKSMTAVAEIAQWAMEDPNKVLWWLTANYEVKDKAWTDLTDHLPQDIIKSRLESKRLIVLGNNSRIYIKSADGKDSL